MKITGSIRNKLIAAIFLGSLIPYILGGAYLKSYTEEWLYNNSIDNANQILHQVSDTIDTSLVSDMEQEVVLLSSVEAVKNAKYNLQNYSHFNRNTFRYRPTEVEKAIEEQFRLLKISHNEVNFVFFGTQDGGYMEYPRFQAVQAYEPRLRPWYTSTLHKEDIVISEPYLTKITNEMVVGFTKQIRDDRGSIVGVLGVTVKLFDLTNRINNIKIGNSGYILLMSPEHKFLVSPHHPEWIMKTPEELGLKRLAALNMMDGEVQFETRLDGKECVLNAVVSKESGWYIVSVMNKGEMLQKAKSVARILLMIYAMILVMTFIVVYLISNRFTRPILEISRIIGRMIDFDFNFSTDLRRYTKQKDEIGTVASAMMEMQDNYTEFIDQVKYIDKKIRNINIEKNELLKVEVSEKNPFHGVIDSMNVLLGKINQNFIQLKETNREINYLALHDSLTKLPNRRQFLDLLTGELQDGKKGAVILLDLDDFKGINDTLGHVFGDRVIEAVAKRLAEVAGDVTVSRFGGDEFLVLMERRGALEELDLLIHKLRDAFSTNVQIDNNDIEIRFSMGISLFPEDGADVNQLIMNADLAMYAVKNAGKNGYKYFNNSMMSSQISKSRIEVLLRDAIENDGFRIVYQPLIDLKTGEIHGYEALLRLKDSDVSPAEFIPIAEINGSIIRIGRIVTEKVVRQLASWKEAGLELKPVSINFSANQLHDSGYLRFIGKQLRKYDIEPGLIGIEITESISLESTKFALAFLKKLREMGISISIDDFGTGYSSLNYLTILPVDKIKLDRVLNEKFLEIDNTEVMRSLISLTHSLGLTVIAEGIETQTQVERLKAAGCDIIQGFYYSVPLGPEQIPDVHCRLFS